MSEYSDLLTNFATENYTKWYERTNTSIRLFERDFYSVDGDLPFGTSL